MTRRGPLREPTLHFFVLAAAVLLGHRLWVGDPRTIELTPGLKADLLRRYQDQLGRPATGAEANAFLETWKAEEALYRESLLEGIDRDDPTVRSVLIGKMRERALLAKRIPEPTEAELQEYLQRHRAAFEAPLIYEHEYVVFPKADPRARDERSRVARELAAGATPASLGLRSTAANVNRERIDREFGPTVADQIVRLAPSTWHELETGDRWILVKLVRVRGGLPPPDELHERLLAAVRGEAQKKALDEVTRAIAERWRFEERAE